MFVRNVIAGLSCVSAACAPAFAFAADGTLTVGATVLPSRPAARVAADFPVPAQGTQLSSTRFGGSWYLPDDVAAVAAFYRAAMRTRGYRVFDDVVVDDAAYLHWERDGERVELRLQSVLGNAPATRMIVSANAG